MYSRESASVIVAPLALLMKRGVPPTPRNARTGLLTPPGITFLARSNRAVDCGYLSFIGSSVFLMGESNWAGHSLQTSCEKSSVYGMICLTLVFTDRLKAQLRTIGGSFEFRTEPSHLTAGRRRRNQTIDGRGR